MRQKNGFSYDGTRISKDGKSELLKKKDAHDLSDQEITNWLKKLILAANTIEDSKELCRDIIRELNDIRGLIGNKFNPFRFLSTSILIIFDCNTESYDKK